jgi:hypothetical protein
MKRISENYRVCGVRTTCFNKEITVKSIFNFHLLHIIQSLLANYYLSKKNPFIFDFEQVEIINRTQMKVFSNLTTV